RYALEMATRFKEAIGDITITVVTVGPDKAKDAIKTCLAVGASKGYIVKADATDAITTADALAKAVAKIEEAEGVKFDIIFCGKESTSTVHPEQVSHNVWG
ncbi:MAG: electron transfer flavoprotein subunit beta, partial [Frisingicoccus sp.]